MTDSIAALSETTIATSTVAISLWSEILPWVEIVLMPLVVIVTAIAAWRVQINVLARRTAFDIILNHELNEDWQILQATARARLAERTSQDDWASIASAWAKNELLKKVTTDCSENSLILLSHRSFVSSQVGPHKTPRKKARRHKRDYQPVPPVLVLILISTTCRGIQVVQSIRSTVGCYVHHATTDEY